MNIKAATNHSFLRERHKVGGNQMINKIVLCKITIKPHKAADSNQNLDMEV